MSDAVAGVGAQLQRGDGESSETFTTIAEVRTFDGPSPTVEIIDFTSLDSTGAYREHGAGFIEPGEITATVLFTQAAYFELLTDLQGREAGNWRIVLPDSAATTLDFAGLVQAVPLSVSPDDAVTFDLSIKVSGAITPSS